MAMLLDRRAVSLSDPLAVAALIVLLLQPEGGGSAGLSRCRSRATAALVALAEIWPRNDTS